MTCAPRVRAARACAALVLGLLSGVLAPLSAQPWYLTDAPGTWKPWKMTLSSGSRAGTKATAAELSAFEAELVKFREILRRTPSAAEPRGYSVEVWGYLGGSGQVVPGQTPPSKLPISGGVDFGAFPIFEYERNGTRIREDTGETELLLFLVNDISPGAIGRPGPSEWRDLEHDVVLQPPALGDRVGWLRYDDFMVLTKRTASLWAPITLLEAWQRQLEASRLALATADEVVEKAKQTLADETDPAKRAAREAGYRKAAPSMPNAQEFLAQMAEVEAIRETAARDALAPTGSSMVRLRDAEREVAAVEAAIAALTAEDRAAPACYVENATRVQGRFRSGPNARCPALVRPNPDFFDRTLPRSAPQVIMVTQVKRCYEEWEARNRRQPDTHVSGCVANRALLASLDRQAVLDWLK